MERYLLTAGGRITCLRCTAKSTMSGNQCLKPALKSSRTQKCGHHGGANKGPKTEAGRARSAAAHLRTGECTKVAAAQRSLKNAELRQLEDVGFVSGLLTGERTRGRKPLGYKPLKTMQEAHVYVLDKISNRA